jgi:predicted transcriptional regulator
MASVGEMVFALLEVGVTQAEIANAAKVHQTTISKLARGDLQDILSQPYLAIKKLYESKLNKEPDDA